MIEGLKAHIPNMKVNEFQFKRTFGFDGLLGIRKTNISNMVMGLEMDRYDGLEISESLSNNIQ
jgi:hypothetical protein